MPRGIEIDSRIVAALKKKNRPVSTLDLAKEIKVSWHPVRFHCLKLKMEGKIDGFRVGHMDLWVSKK
ncbi:MAG: hypothetical protein AABX14_00975 [Candidatus Aenigmatarchaeota archaeon]